MQSVERLGARSGAAVPALIKAVNDPLTRRRALRALGRIGPEARPAIPDIEKLLSTADLMAAATALHKINSNGTGVKLLIDAVGDPGLRLPAIHALGEVGPSAMPAVDVLLEALRVESGIDRAGGPQWTSIADALLKISPTNRAVISILYEKLENANERYSSSKPNGQARMLLASERLNIAAYLVRFDPADPRGLEVLTETLRSDPQPGNREFAAYVLRQAGPGARAAVPALETALKDKDERVRRSAASALRKIRASESARP